MKNISFRTITVFLILMALGVNTFYDFYKNKIIENKCVETEVFYEGKCFSQEIKCEVNNGEGTQVFSGGTYSICQIIACNEGFETVDEQCLPIIRERSIFYTGTIVATNYSLNEYPSIKVNEPIEGGNIFFNVNFTDDFMNGQYDNFIYGGTANGGPANPAPFGLYFFLGRETVPSLSPWLAFGGFVHAISYNNGGDLRTTQELNGVVPGSAIVGGYIRDIPITNNLTVATKRGEWKEDYKFKNIPLLNFLNNSVGDDLFIGGFLSSVSGREGWTFTKILSIEIRYIGNENAIKFN